jgi:peptidyl-prolyl cis-trans isomerase C
MKSIAIFMLCIAPAVFAQAPSALTPETVVATVGGKPVTAGELMTLLSLSPPEAQKNLLKDGKLFIEQLALMQKLAAMAEKAQLDKQSPFKEQLDAFRRQTLANAQLAAQQDSITVSGEEQQKFYKDNQDRYIQAKVKVLYVAFQAAAASQADPKAKKNLTEPEAKRKIEKLLTQIRSGADFVKLVKENSDDAESAAKDGDFGTLIRRSDELPENIKGAIFALKPGQVTDPLRVASGFYLFRLEEMATVPYEKVRDDVFIEIRQKRFDQWFSEVKKGLDVKIVNEDFFNKTAAGLVAPKK